MSDARINPYGAVDLSKFGRPAGEPPERNEAAHQAGVVIDVDEAQFSSIVQLSLEVPVVIDLWATWCEPCKQLSPLLEKLALEYAGAFLLAKIDVDANPQIAQAFQVQSVPSVVALVKGQPVPLFQGALDEAQVRGVLTQLLDVAKQHGVTGKVPGVAPGEAEVEEPEPELPPLHQEAFDAVERDDLPGAIAAYEKALAQNPADDMARLGLAQVQLLQRTRGVDLAQARQEAAARPDDVAAQLLVADLDVLGGAIADAFDRLLDTVRATSGDDRDQVRQHLVTLFDVVGHDDARVIAARRELASALY